MLFCANAVLVPADLTLFILSGLNPDGEAPDHNADGRANAHGGDLNRNWAINWHTHWNNEKCWNLRPFQWKICFSEPETRTLQLFLLYHTIIALIS